MGWCIFFFFFFSLHLTYKCVLSQDAVGPAGLLGWTEIQNLAEALFKLRNANVLTELQVDSIINYWDKLPEGFRHSRVLYPSRFRKDSDHTGRFMRKKPGHKQTVSVDTVSLKR